MKRILDILLCSVLCMALLSGQAFAAGAVKAPGQITVKVTADKNVTVSWSKTSGVKGYKVYRAYSGSKLYSCIKTISSKSTVKYTDKTVKPGRKYSYKVRAYKVVNGRNTYSKFTKIKTVYVKPESWNTGRLEKDIVSYLEGKGYNVVLTDYSDKWCRDHSLYYASVVEPSWDYKEALKEVKGDALRYASSLENSYGKTDAGLYYDVSTNKKLKDNVFSIGLKFWKNNGYVKVFVTDESKIDEDSLLLTEGEIQQYRMKVLELVNAERAKLEEEPLVLDEKLCNMAQAKAREMAELNYFSHISPTYGDLISILSIFDITYRKAGENIGKCYETAEDVMAGWMNSQGHRDNIQTPGYTRIGIGVYADKETGTKYWVQEFIE